MITNDKAIKLIKVYTYICSIYEDILSSYCQRYSNNSKPIFTDQEILTIYFFVGSEQQYMQLKQIHSFAKDYLLDWFAKLVSYQTFVYRLNRMVGAVQYLMGKLLQEFVPEDCDEDTIFVDLMPIMTCCGRNRHGKVAREVVDKGYCSTKEQYYYGLKLHLIGSRREGHIPYPYQLILSSASENDLSVFKRECVPMLENKIIFADKIYRETQYWKEEAKTKGNQLLTPIKAIKGMSDEEKKRDKAANDLYSAAVSSIREPIEAFFSWLIRITDIQRAYRCRSTQGLLIHIFGKIVIAFVPLIFNY